MGLISFFKSKVFFKNVGYIVASFVVIVVLTAFLLKAYTHHGKTYRVPDLKGLSTAQVVKQLQHGKLRYQVIDSLYVPELIPGTVMAQHPKAGAKVKQNRLIFITICSLSPEKVKVPDLTDISLREAINRLSNSGLRLGKIESRPSEFNNLVLYQTIEGKKIPKNTFVNKGTEIDLVVGRGLSDEKTLVPELIGRNLTEAEQILQAIGLEIGVLVYDKTITSSSDSANAIIWRQRPDYSLSKEIEIGSSIDLWLTSPSFGVEMNSQIFEE